MEDLFKNRISRGAVVGIAGPSIYDNTQVAMTLALSAATGIRLVQGFAPERELRTLAVFGWKTSERTYPEIWEAFDAYRLDEAARDCVLANLPVSCGWKLPLENDRPTPNHNRAFDKLLDMVCDIHPDLVILDRKEAFIPLSGRRGPSPNTWPILMWRLTHATESPCSVIVTQTAEPSEAVADECLSHAFFRVSQLVQGDGGEWGIAEPWRFLKIEQTAGTYGPRSQSAILPRGWDAPEADAKWLGRRAVA